MFRKLAWELTLTYLLIIIFSMGVLGTYLLGYLDDYFTRYTGNELFTQAYTIAEAWPRTQQLETLTRKETYFYRGIITRLSNQTGSQVVILSERGSPVWNWPQSIPYDPNISLRSEVKSAMKGKPAAGNMEGYLSSAYPIKETSSDGKETRVIGVVYVSRSKTYLQSIILELRNRFFTGFLISLAVSLILSIVFSHYITKPITEITRVAENMAKGELNQRAGVSGRNEIGVLAQRFNMMAEKLQGTLEALMDERNKLSAIIDNMAGGVVVVDIAGNIIMINNTAMKLLGLRDPEILEKNISRVMPGHSLLHLLEDSENHREVHGQLEEFPDERAVDAHITPLFSKTSRPIGMVIILNDVTEFRRLDQMKTEFVSNVSHELRTPLASIKGLAELLLDGALKEDRAEEFLDSINKEVDRLTRLVKDLLDLSKMESGMVKMEKHPVNMEYLTTQVLKRLTPQARKKQILIVADLKCDTPAYANMDRVQQVLINLIDNAMRYTPEGERIIVRLMKKDDFCRVEVEDTGPGISPENMERVFERFFRADRARARHGGGFGLGLAICRQIIENLNGTIGVNSIPPAGTTFHFTLPLMKS